MKAYRTTTSLAVIFVVLMTTAARCPWQDAKVAVDDVAREMAAAGRGGDELAPDLKKATGNSDEIDKAMADRLVESGVIGKMFEKAPEVVELACEAFDNGQKLFATSGEGSATDQAAQLLVEMDREAENFKQGAVAVQTACNLLKVGNGV